MFRKLAVRKSWAGIFFLLIALAFGLGGKCEGDQGYPGPQGEQGDPGADGSSAWADITGKPAGFADDVDNEGSGAWADITGKPAGFADDTDDEGWSSANDGAGSGLDADLLDGQQGSYYLGWSNLTGVPAGFADGVDNTGATNHGALTGLGDDDHPQYLLADGTRPLTGPIDFGDYNLTNAHDIYINDDIELLGGTSSEIIGVDNIIFQDGSVIDPGSGLDFEIPAAQDFRWYIDSVLLLRFEAGLFDVRTPEFHTDGNIDADGDISCSGTKFFVQDHPTNSTKSVYYACLEGPEAGTYCRGKGKLVNGMVVIDLPEHFALVTNENEMTVQVTPTADCNGLFVVKYDNRQITVKELGRGKSNATFHWFVNGVRKGYESYQVIRDKKN